MNSKMKALQNAMGKKGEIIFTPKKKIGEIIFTKKKPITAPKKDGAIIV